MKQIILFIGMIAAVISGGVSIVTAIMGMADGADPSVIAYYLLLAPAIMFALAITFKYVLDQLILAEEPKKKRPQGQPKTKPTADTVGTPWANNPGGEDL